MQTTPQKEALPKQQFLKSSTVSLAVLCAIIAMLLSYMGTFEQQPVPEVRTEPKITIPSYQDQVDGWKTVPVLPDNPWTPEQLVLLYETQRHRPIQFSIERCQRCGSFGRTATELTKTLQDIFPNAQVYENQMPNPRNGAFELLILTPEGNENILVWPGNLRRYLPSNEMLIHMLKPQMDYYFKVFP